MTAPAGAVSGRTILGEALTRVLTPPAREWLDAASHRAAADPAAIRADFPAAARACGSGPLGPQASGPAGAPEQSPPSPPGAIPGTWTIAEAARAWLLLALPLQGAALAEAVTSLYWDGDAAEQRAVLLALPLIEDAEPSLGDRALPVVSAALRSNDTRLIEAAAGIYGARHLPAQQYRHAVLKCVFCGIPLQRVAGLPQRADAELTRMLAAFAAERRAAGRDVPAGLPEPQGTA